MTILLGTYQHALDAKGRVSLPAQFRKELPEKVVIAPAVEQDSLNIYTLEGFKAWVDAMFGPEGFQANNPEHAKFRRWCFGNAANVDVDTAGRINIPQNLRELAGLVDKVIFIGDEDHVGVWSPERQDQSMEGYDPSAIYSHI